MNVKSLPICWSVRGRLVVYLILIGVMAAAGGSPPVHASPFTVKTASAPPEIVFGLQSLEIKGITSGKEVFVLSVWREGNPWAITEVTRNHWLLEDDDRDGVVSLDLGRDVPVQSIWGAVDLKSGQGLLAVPDGYRLWEIPLKDLSLDVPKGSLGIRRTSLELVVVRPNVGYWRHRVRDGNPNDEDMQFDRGVRVSLERFGPPVDVPPRGPAPERFAAGDVVFAIDTRTMEVAAVEVE